MSPDEPVDLREYFEAILEEHRRAVVIAEQEREKAASALRDALSERIQSGDKQLEAHINGQVESIRLALVAAKELSDQRQASQEKAVDKAFEAASELAHKHNDLIAKGERDRDLFATQIDLVYLREKLEQGAKERERLNDALTTKIGRQEYDKAEDEWGEWRVTVEARLGHFAATLSQQEAVNKSLTEYQREKKDDTGVTIGQVIAVFAVILTLAAILVGAFT
ncbi:MAG: hypothetical protein H0U55_11710 [Rubrobacteraceae bacterium]|nr:hypothetical protein [Rubrobacteraceae bacterium]